MPRGRQYYDPIVQVPGMVDGEGDLSRIEVFMDESLQWNARQVAADGSLTGNTIQNFNHEGLLRQIRETWPTHPIYELRNESDDSTWEGHGPSPRLWQVGGATPTEIPPALPATEIPVFEDQDALDAAPLQMRLRALVAPESGAYVLLSDILGLLESWAVSFEIGKNPSGAMALREAVDALKDIG